MTTLGGFGMVMYMIMLMCLVLVEQICYAAAAEEQVPKLATANTSTTWYREHVRNITAAHITWSYAPHSIQYMITPQQIYTGERGGFLKCAATAKANTSQVFECWAASSLATDTGENKSAVTW